MIIIILYFLEIDISFLKKKKKKFYLKIYNHT